MSLLLDALNRASRDKAAGAAAQNPSGESDGGVVAPAAPPAAAAPPVVVGQTETNPLSPNAPDWPPLEFSLTSPDPAPVVKPQASILPSGGKPAVLSLTPKLPETAPAIDPVNIIPVPAAPAEPVAVAPATTAPFFNAEPVQLPPGGVRAAQNIVRAKALPAATGNKRWVVLLAVAVLLSAGMASFLLGLGGDLRALAGIFGLDSEMGKTNAVVVTAAPAAPILTEIQPGVPATVVAMPPETAALAATPSTVSAPPAPTVARAPRTPTVRPRPRDAPALPIQTPVPNDNAWASVQSSSSGPSILEIAYQDLISGRLPEAGAAYAQALAVNPQERDALLGLAYIAQRQGRKDESLSFYKRVLRQEPGNVTARAGILSLNPSGDLQDFGNQSREVAEQNPDSAAAQSALGHALVRQDRLADARVAFSRAMQLAPEVPRHAFNLAVAFDRLHNYDEAQRYYERAVSLMKQRGSEGTSGFSLADVMTRLEQLRYAASSTHLPPN